MISGRPFLLPYSVGARETRFSESAGDLAASRRVVSCDLVGPVNRWFLNELVRARRMKKSQFAAGHAQVAVELDQSWFPEYPSLF